MKQGTLPRTRMDLRPDPLLDESRGQRWRRGLKPLAWIAVALLSCAGIATEIDRHRLARNNADLKDDVRRLAEELVDTKRRLTALRSDGTCTSLFYLVEATDAASIDARLRHVSLAIDDERIRVLASIPVEVPAK